MTTQTCVRCGTPVKRNGRKELLHVDLMEHAHDHAAVPERSLDERYESVHQAILAGPYREVQELVDSGEAWRLEGAIGRMVQAALQSGAAVLPPYQVKDFYGNTVPSYGDVEDEPGSPGSVANAESYEEQP